MARVRFIDVQSRPTEFLDFTSLTLGAFQQLVPPFEARFHARMVARRMDGKPRTARRFPVDKNCPLPTPGDRLLFILVSLKTSAFQVVHGRFFGMIQGKTTADVRPIAPIAHVAGGAARPWRCPGPLPHGPGPAPVVVGLAAVPASPLVLMTGRNGASSAPKTLLHRLRVRAARKKTTR